MAFLNFHPFPSPSNKAKATSEKKKEKKKNNNLEASEHRTSLSFSSLPLKQQPSHQLHIMSDNVENTPVEAVVATETPAVAEAPAATEVAAVAAETAETVPATTSDASVVDKDEEKAKILKQVEFYFSDSNLPVDKFLNELVNKAKDGCTYS